MARLLITAGLVLLVLGVVAMALDRLQLPLGRLPGDIVWRSKRSTVYFPVVTCILLSVFGSLLLWLFNRR